MTNAYNRYKAVDAELDLLYMQMTKLRLKENALITEKGSLWWEMFPAEREEADECFLAKVQV